MKPYQANLLNSVILIVMPLWAYFSFQPPLEDPQAVASITTFIPAILAVILLICNNGVKKENKVVAHIAVLVTLLAIIGLLKPLTGALEKDSFTAILRVSLMLLSSTIAMGVFINSFINNRKKKA